MGTDLRRDLPFSINGDKFLIEVQTQHDKTMIFRLVEYKLHGMIQDLSKINWDNSTEMIIKLPQEVLIQLDKSSKTPNEYVVKYQLNDQEITQKIPIIKLWEHDVKSLAQDSKALLLPFLLNKYKHSFRQNPSDGNLGLKFVQEIKDIAHEINVLYNEGKLSEKLAVEMVLARESMVIGLKNQYIAGDNPVREELETMLNVMEEPFVSGVDKLIEQGKQMMQPTIDRLQDAIVKEKMARLDEISKLQDTMQQKETAMKQKETAMQKKLQQEQQARQKEQQAHEKEIAELKQQLAQAIKKGKYH